MNNERGIVDSRTYTVDNVSISNRKHPYMTWYKAAVKDMLDDGNVKEMLYQHSMFVEYPEQSNDYGELNIMYACAVVKKLYISGNELKADVDFIDTPACKQIKDGSKLRLMLLAYGEPEDNGIVRHAEFGKLYFMEQE